MTTALRAVGANKTAQVSQQGEVDSNGGEPRFDRAEFQLQILARCRVQFKKATRDDKYEVDSRSNTCLPPLAFASNHLTKHN